MASDERALRRMIAQLAEMPVRDCEIVLAALTQTQRERVGALLDEYAGDGRSDQLPQVDRNALTQGLSPWLAELVGHSGSDGEAREGARSLTVQTARALYASAAELRPLAGDAAVPRSGLWTTLSHRFRPAAGREAR